MSRYDGLVKHWTLDCEECPYRLEIYCRWGVAIKKLEKWGKNRHCEYHEKEPPNGSAHTLNMIYIAKHKIQKSRIDLQAKLF